MLRDLPRCRGLVNAEIAANAWWHELTPRLARSEPRCLVVRKNCMTWDPGGVASCFATRESHREDHCGWLDGQQGRIEN
jgi:hypothetical protein